ncbi:hypothetical protein DAEQUDRAFT_723246 [Daedalea quercina L-15889]|uniref:Hemerythrin-like domain-containing protein n=1 Tax=Daedalea quercina L-15889 TaxID=1314783 RepID=A0A165SJD6_9APHY|nr:hypothetical protein DAEQUDRAFT_723246 [Daedalea quercina L-15889]
MFGRQSRGLSKAMQEAKWNSIADHMQSFHDHFKVEFNNIYKLADGTFNSRGMSLHMYLRICSQLVRHLTAHHTIEERYVFPVLAKRMPEFREDDKHIKAHHAIHEGLEKLDVLISKWSKDTKTYSPAEMKGCLDSWREVLFEHLDQEVQDLGAENMKKYWKLEELDQIPM